MMDLDDIIIQSPTGWLYTLVAASLAKRRVEAPGLLIPDRLRLLEGLGKLSGGSVTAAAVAHVAPACATAEAMADAAGYNLDVFGTCDVFREFARLNPSLLEALRLCGSFYPIK
jgi:hypothetical protein